MFSQGAGNIDNIVTKICKDQPVFEIFVTMFPHGAGNIDNIVTKVCKDKLQCRQVKDRCLNFLSNVEVPFGWKDESSSLDQDLLKNKYRLQILKAFVAKKEADGVFVLSSTCEEFFDELKQFSLDSRIDDDPQGQHTAK